MAQSPTLSAAGSCTRRRSLRPEYAIVDHLSRSESGRRQARSYRARSSFTLPFSQSSRSAAREIARPLCCEPPALGGAGAVQRPAAGERIAVSDVRPPRVDPVAEERDDDGAGIVDDALHLAVHRGAL